MWRIGLVLLLVGCVDLQMTPWERPAQANYWPRRLPTCLPPTVAGGIPRPFPCSIGSGIVSASPYEITIREPGLDVCCYSLL